MRVASLIALPSPSPIAPRLCTPNTLTHSTLPLPPPQVLLYLLLMEERYGRPLEWGMLWYTHQPGELGV